MFKRFLKRGKYKTNGVSLQHTVSLITQDFLNTKYDKRILKEMRYIEMPKAAPQKSIRHFQKLEMILK